MDCLVNKHILVTGGGAPGAYGIITALKSVKGTKVSSCDIKDEVIGQYLAEDFFTVPSGDALDYCNVLLQECLARKVDLIFPITTKELIPLSAHQHLFKEQGIEVLVSKQKDLEIANNKGKLYSHLQQANVRVPHFYVVNTFEEFKRALTQYKESEAIAFKPCVANGSRGFRIINPTLDEHDLWLNHKPSSTYISKQNALVIVEHEPFTSLLISNYLDGDEYSVDCLIDRNKNSLIIPRLRSKINNGISVEGEIIKNDELISYCKEILSTLDLLGPIGIQVKYHQNKAYILEINPRIQGTSIACLGAGVNIPVLSAAIAMGHELDSKLSEKIKWGTRFIRHYQEFFIP